MDSFRTTPLSLRALWLYRHLFAVTQALDNAQAFLLAQRQAGVWPETFETATALIAILPRLPDPSLVAESIAYLEPMQLENGSWDDDVYTTALALRALHLARAGIPNPDLGAVVGFAIDGNTGFPLRGVTVELSGPVHAALETGSDGRFTVPDITASEVRLRFRFEGYVESAFSLPVEPLTDLDMGRWHRFHRHRRSGLAHHRG